MLLWESVDDIGREIEHRGLKIRQMSHDLLFYGLSGDNPCMVNMFSMEPYALREDKPITDLVMECIMMRRTYGTKVE